MTTELTTACAKHLFNHFDWQARASEVVEQVSVQAPEAFDKAIGSFMRGDNLALRLVLESAAMTLCERSAKTLVSGYGDGWYEQLNVASYD